MRLVNKKITTNFHQNGVTFCAVVVVVVVILFELGYNSFATKNKHISSNFGDCQGFQTLHFVSHISVCSQLRAHTFTLSQCDDRMISLALTLCECELVHMFKYRMTLFYTMPRIWTANSRIIHRFLRASTLITNSTTCSYAQMQNRVNAHFIRLFSETTTKWTNNVLIRFGMWNTKIISK